jgi:hypothetical protein
MSSGAPAHGRWYIRNQQNVNFGQTGDVPLPLICEFYGPRG